MNTKYDWSNVPDNVKWIATDIQGYTWGFIPMPPKLSGGFWGKESDFILLGKNIYDGYWVDSLEERPL